MPSPVVGALETSAKHNGFGLDMEETLSEIADYSIMPCSLLIALKLVGHGYMATAKAMQLQPSATETSPGVQSVSGFGSEGLGV